MDPSHSMVWDCPGKKNKGKVPKRIQKAEREKLKREHLNDLFSRPSQCSCCLEQVIVEKNELREENSALEIEIEKLQSELEERIAQSKLDLNVPPPEFQQPELTSHFPGDCVRLPAVEPSSQQVPAVFVLPIRPGALPDVTQQTFKPNSNVSKPHARYPIPTDSWPSQLLGEQPTARKEF
ncbi:hypothetical protein SO802_020737 [Lithocarpus litseifolius]|uniref:Iron-related transcription factor 3 bHLH domain-containing protein n=1 Tax=Lithocarpus litseifolius TaxID=425828 RepID=A0AAW2CCY8_9ROSI